MGVLDESGFLKYGQVFVQIRRNDEEGTPLQRVSGNVAVAKNPCLHPGDVRVLEAVFDIPQGHRLEKLVNCVVFPNNGQRPHTDECSGSDLDGDLYFVTWDKRLVPRPEDVHPPMDYKAAPAQMVGQVTMEHVHDFIINYMKNDQLGQICSWHVANADLHLLGVKSPICMELARQASIAVDYPKTGVPAEKKHEWMPKSYPDFMKKADKVTHESQKVLGKLFQEIKHVRTRVERDGTYGAEARLHVLLDSLNQHFDLDLLVPGYERHLSDARATKESFEHELRGIMRKYSTFCEAEVIGGFLLESPRRHRRQKLFDVQEFVSDNHFEFCVTEISCWCTSVRA